MVENWKDIPGYGGKYKVNTMGDVTRVYKPGKAKARTRDVEVDFHRHLAIMGRGL